MRSFTIILISCFITLGNNSYAQDEIKWMSSDALKRELSDVMLIGTVEGSYWQECIRANGKTRYTLEGSPPSYGHMKITETALACFVYAGLKTCFRVEQRGDSYAFHVADSDGTLGILVFTTHQIERRITSCALTNIS